MKRSKIVEGVDDDNNQDTSNEPSSKRRRVDSSQTSSQIPQQPSTSSPFTKGSIVRITMKNFVTYDHIEMHPGPSMNVILGPNGSGKSSIVCGIVLGLGGSPELLGRAKKVGDFVKHGREYGWTEIELFDACKGGNLTIKREIRTDNSNKWWVNGRLSNKQDVQTRIKQLNIQVDNLCQFLPQDKVVSFSQMDAFMLLKETERAVGSPQLLEDHMKLISSRNHEKELVNLLDGREKHLAELERQNQWVKKEVERFQQRQQWIEKLKLLELKLPWLRYEKELERAQHFADLIEQAQAAYDRFQQEMGPLTEEINLAKTAEKRSMVDLRDARDKAQTLVDSLKKSGEKLDSMESDYENALDQLKNVGQLRKNIQRDADRTRNAINELEEKLNDSVFTDEHEKQLISIRRQYDQEFRQMNQVKSRFQEVADQLQSIRSEKQVIFKQLEDLNNIKKRRLNHLRDIDKELYNAVMHIENNEARFRRPILGPIFMEINVSEDLHARYFETVIYPWVLRGFVAQTEEDRDLLLDMFMASRYRVSVFYSEEVLNVAETRHQVPDHLRKSGVICYMDQLATIEQPAVHTQLVQQCKYQSVAILKKESSPTNFLSDQKEISRVLTPDSYGTSVKSRFTAESSIRVRTLKKSKLITPGGFDTQKKRQLEEQLAELQRKEVEMQEAQSHITAETAEYERRISGYRHEMDKLQQLKALRVNLQRQIETKKKSLKRYENDLEAANRTEEDRKHTVIETVKRKSTEIIRFTEIGTKTLEASKAADIALTIRIDCEHKVQRISQRLTELTQRQRQLERELAIAKDQYRQAKFDLDRAKAEAERHPINNEIRQQFADLPNTVEELEDEIQTARAHAESIANSNPKIIEEYEKRCAEIDSLKTEIDDLRTQLANHQTDIRKTQTEWLHEVRRIVKKIDTSFSRYFKNIGCAGRIILVEDEDYDKYALDIRVQFRSHAEAQTLNAHVQSGGERSVSTMLYLISLQELVISPFRLVDEINQGMDPINERMIFEEVAKTACTPGQAQFFMITPKLLPGLQFNPEITVHCVINGPWNEVSFDR